MKVKITADISAVGNAEEYSSFEGYFNNLEMPDKCIVLSSYTILSPDSGKITESFLMMFNPISGVDRSCRFGQQIKYYSWYYYLPNFGIACIRVINTLQRNYSLQKEAFNISPIQSCSYLFEDLNIP